jgi:hypothetical protein
MTSTQPTHLAQGALGFSAIAASVPSTPPLRPAPEKVSYNVPIECICDGLWKHPSTAVCSDYDELICANLSNTLAVSTTSSADSISSTVVRLASPSRHGNAQAFKGKMVGQTSMRSIQVAWVAWLASSKSREPYHNPGSRSDHASRVKRVETRVTHPYLRQLLRHNVSWCGYLPLWFIHKSKPPEPEVQDQLTFVSDRTNNTPGIAARE